MSPLLEVDNLFAGYGETIVVRGLSFTLASGEVLALLGPNGAGKTTSLLTLSKLIPALGGSVTVLGNDIQSASPEHLARMGLAHVPEDRSLFTRLTVRENLILAAGKDQSVIDETLDLFPPLQPLLNVKAGSLSGGEQQMLAIARALTQRPRVLMIDEMSMGLAPLIIEDLLRIVRGICENTGAAILLVEQHVHVALAIADRALLLVHGNVVWQGPISTLMDGGSVALSYLGSYGHEPATSNGMTGEDEGGQR